MTRSAGVVGRSVGSAATPETFKYDAIDRLIRHTDALGTFTLGYVGGTDQPSERQLAGKLNVTTVWNYLPATGDRRLAGIAHMHIGERQFKYATTAEGLISQITEENLAGGLLQKWSLGYDSNDRLTTADSSQGAKYGYTLDPAGNITSHKTPGSTSDAVYNKVNELTELAGKPYSYDADSNELSDGARKYSWDAESRLVGISYAGSKMTTRFAYDGLDRRVAITTTDGNKTTTEHYIWCGSQIWRSRTGATAVDRLYYDEGGYVPSAKASYYYGPDQQGSVRDVYATSPKFSAVVTYDYGPYGNLISPPPKSGLSTDFRYAGSFYRADSGLYLTQDRAYDPRTARWLSRDPLGEDESPNLYAYAEGDPLNAVGEACLNGTTCLPAKPFAEWTALEPPFETIEALPSPPSEPPSPPSPPSIVEQILDWTD